MKYILMIVACMYAFLGEVNAIEDETWNKLPPLSDKHDLSNFVLRSLSKDGFSPLTSEVAAQEVKKFKGASLEDKRAHIKSYSAKFPYLVFIIGSSCIDDPQRAVMRQMIWNRIENVLC